MEQETSFGELLRHYRKSYRYNCTQAEIAARFGYSKETISSWEQGRRFPAYHEVTRLAQLMGLNLQEVKDAIQVGHVRLYLNSVPEKTFLAHGDFSIANGPLFLESEQESDAMNKQRRELLRLLSTAGALFVLPHDDVWGTIGFEEGTFALYEDLLAMGWEATWRGGIEQFAPRFNRQLARLAVLADKPPLTEREQWLTLLCRYYQLATRFAQRQMKTKQALCDAQSGIEVATQLEDAELLASAYFWRARLHLEQKHRTLAKDDVDAALVYAERVRSPLKGNIYLVAAEVYADGAENSQQMKTQCDRWHEQVANLVYKGGIEEDDSFVKLNVTTTHHERAKTLIQLHRFKEARNELNTAWKTLSPDLVIWRINLSLTEARLYCAEKDIEGSAQLASEALNIAKVLHAQDKVSQVYSLCLQLKEHDANNPYVCNLGMQLDAC
ncbi:MAG: helix-turn-helix domain-containing protein [Ktedonobacteraceae bacterium]